MANRSFNRKQSLEKEIKELYAKLTIGASGAVTLTTGIGIASVAKTATGDYLVTLQDKYTSLKSFQATVLSSTAEDLTVQLKAESVAVAKTLSFYTLTAGTATSPASGDVILIQINLKNTTAV